jgi:hypothetical protein
MIKLSERSRNLASQVLFQRRSHIEDDMKRYLAASHTPSATFNHVSKENAKRLAIELAAVDVAIEELRTC